MFISARNPTTWAYINLKTWYILTKKVYLKLETIIAVRYASSILCNLCYIRHCAYIVEEQVKV